MWSIFSGLSVAFGAFGAHALKTRLDSYYLDIFETAVKYQMYHGLALIALAFVATRFDGTWLRACGILMILGILLFSGSLYALVFSGIKKWEWLLQSEEASLSVHGVSYLFWHLMHGLNPNPKKELIAPFFI